METFFLMIFTYQVVLFVTSRYKSPFRSLLPFKEMLNVKLVNGN